MNEKLQAIWTALDSLAFDLKLSREGLRQVLEQNRALMLLYVDLDTQRQVLDAQKTGAIIQAPADQSANGHKPVSSKA
jgi:hypothetical protein